MRRFVCHPRPAASPWGSGKSATRIRPLSAESDVIYALFHIAHVSARFLPRSAVLARAGIWDGGSADCDQPARSAAPAEEVPLTVTTCTPRQRRLPRLVWSIAEPSGATNFDPAGHFCTRHAGLWRTRRPQTLDRPRRRSIGTSPQGPERTFQVHVVMGFAFAPGCRDRTRIIGAHSLRRISNSAPLGSLGLRAPGQAALRLTFHRPEYSTEIEPVRAFNVIMSRLEQGQSEPPWCGSGNTT